MAHHPIVDEMMRITPFSPYSPSYTHKTHYTTTTTIFCVVAQQRKNNNSVRLVSLFHTHAQ